MKFFLSLLNNLEQIVSYGRGKKNSLDLSDLIGLGGAEALLVSKSTWGALNTHCCRDPQLSHIGVL